MFPLSGLSRTIVLFLVACSVSAFAQTVQRDYSLELIPVFEARKLGYRLTRIPAIVLSDKGTLIAFSEGRAAPGDWADIDIIARRSRDGGTTWSDTVILAKSEGGPISNATPMPTV